jgi:hypothetical protein
VSVEDFIRVEATDAVPDAAQALFRRKYGRDIPDFPHHVVAYLCSAEALQPLCYVHFTDCGDILLGGGACSDDRLMRRMSEPQRADVRAAGGLYQYALSWSVRHFAPHFEAIFGYCGDALAERVDRAVGFESTPHEHLLVYWTRPSDARKRRWMIEKAHSFAPF